MTTIPLGPMPGRLPISKHTARNPARQPPTATRARVSPAWPRPRRNGHRRRRRAGRRRGCARPRARSAQMPRGQTGIARGQLVINPLAVRTQYVNASFEWAIQDERPRGRRSARRTLSLDSTSGGVGGVARVSAQRRSRAGSSSSSSMRRRRNRRGLRTWTRHQTRMGNGVGCTPCHRCG